MSTSDLPTLAFGEPRARGDLPVSLDRLIESKLLVQANSGGGKSWAVRYLLEQTHGQVQHIVLDREGEFATLREQYPYLLAGREGDVAADVRSAKLLARKLLETGLSAVIDLSEMSLGQQREYMRVFIDAINHMPRALWKDCLIVIDEAHLFAPEKGKGSSEASEAIALLLSTGRKRGYCVVLATQRIAKLDKDVSAECLNKLIGRTSEEDLRRAAEELGMGKPESKALRALDPGTFWAYGPAIVPDPIIARTGEVQTQPPKRGTARAAAPDAPAAIRKVMATFADLPKQAADEAASVDDLQRQLRELRTKLQRAERDGVERVVEKPVVDQRAIDRALAADRRETKRRLRLAVRDIAGAAKALDTSGQTLVAIGAALDTMAEETTEDSRAEGQVGHQESSARGANRASVSSVDRTSRAPARSIDTPSSAGGTSGVGKTPQRMLNALRFLESVGTSPASRAAIAGLVGVSWDTGTFRNYLSELRGAGFIADGPGTDVALTPAGRAAASDEGLPTSTAELHEAWRSKLGSTPARMLDELLKAHPDAMSREALGRACGISHDTGTFRNYLSELRSPGLITDVSRTHVRAADALFPEGLS